MITWEAMTSGQPAFLEGATLQTSDPGGHSSLAPQPVGAISQGSACREQGPGERLKPRAPGCTR